MRNNVYYQAIPHFVHLCKHSRLNYSVLQTLHVDSFQFSIFIVSDNKIGITKMHSYTGFCHATMVASH